MKEGNVVVTPLPQSDGKIKNRPAVVLREMPLFGDFLVCGISTRVHQLAPDFDELLTDQDDDFQASGLIATSVIRLGFLAVLPRKNIVGSIGVISPERHRRLLEKLSAYLIDKSAG